MNSYIVGITGGSASGKTHFLKELMNYFEPSQLCLISQDDYYKVKDLQPLDGNRIENYDTPQSIDLNLFIKDLRNLCAGEEVVKEGYTFNNPAIKPKTLHFKPSPVILVEGIFIFYHPEIWNLLNLKIFIEAKEHVKLKRRIRRDQNERGYSQEDVLYRWEHHISPTFNKYIHPFKENADLIIPNNENFNNALEVVVGFLKNKVLPE